MEKSVYFQLWSCNYFFFLVCGYKRKENIALNALGWALWLTGPGAYLLISYTCVSSVSTKCLFTSDNGQTQIAQNSLFSQLRCKFSIVMGRGEEGGSRERILSDMECLQDGGVSQVTAKGTRSLFFRSWCCCLGYLFRAGVCICFPNTEQVPL